MVRNDIEPVALDDFVVAAAPFALREADEVVQLAVTAERAVVVAEPGARLLILADCAGAGTAVHIAHDQHGDVFGNGRSDRVFDDLFGLTQAGLVAAESVEVGAYDAHLHPFGFGVGRNQNVGPARRTLVGAGVHAQQYRSRIDDRVFRQNAVAVGAVVLIVGEDEEREHAERLCAFGQLLDRTHASGRGFELVEADDVGVFSLDLFHGLGDFEIDCIGVVVVFERLDVPLHALQLDVLCLCRRSREHHAEQCACSEDIFVDFHNRFCS